VSRPVLRKAPNIIIVDYTGKRKRSILGTTTLPINIQGKVTSANCFVAEALNQDLLLGREFLQASQITLDFKFGEATVDIEKRENHPQGHLYEYGKCEFPNPQRADGE